MKLEKLNPNEVESFIHRLDEVTKVLMKELSRSANSLNGERFYTNQGICNTLHLSKRTLQEYRDNGILKFIKLPGKILYKESDIRKLLDKNYHNNNNL